MGLFGLIFNSLSLFVFSRPSMHSIFHQLLIALAVFDILLLISGTLWIITFQNIFSVDSLIYLFPYYTYPIFYFAMYGSTYMTLAISIERYLGICHTSIEDRKARFYIVPVVFVALVFAIPKFLEVKISFEEQSIQGIS